MAEYQMITSCNHTSLSVKRMTWVISRASLCYNPIPFKLDFPILSVMRV